MSKEALKQAVCEAIDRHGNEIIELGEAILHHPETGFNEVKTAALVAERFLQNPGDIKLSQARPNFLESFLERRYRHLSSASDESNFTGVLRLSKGFHQIHLRAPLPPRSVGEQTLKVAVQQVGGFESNDLERGE